MLELAAQKTDTSTDYLVFPETALTESIWDNDLKQTGSYSRLREFLRAYPKLKIVTGASTFHLFQKGEKLSVTARKFKQQEGYYDAFNTALQIDNTDLVQSYHKSKLVPGVERMPYPAVFGFLEDFAIDLGGTSGSLGTQEERTVFHPTPALPKGEGASPPLGETGEGVAPIICFESVFGEFVSEFVRNGANMIFVITNDGWWGDTPGYKQHLIYGRLRAIETRRSIARSANTGISCFINQRGDISQPTEWWTPAVIQANINSNTTETFYVKHGDLIGRVCFYVSGIILLLLIALSLRARFGAKQSHL
jgi:apolipoprotein N-acyltransferase